MDNILLFATLAILTAVYQIGFSALFDEHMLFERIGKFLTPIEDGLHRKKGLPMWINKPIWYCPPCMSSIHGTAIYLLLGTALGLPWEFVIPFDVLVVGIVTVLFGLMPKDEISVINNY